MEENFLDLQQRVDMPAHQEVDWTQLKRGTVWWVDLDLVPGSRLQGGPRPCLIVSADNTARLGIVTVCPLSTRIDDYSTHVKVWCRKEGQVLCEQITTIDTTRIGTYNGRLSDKDLSAVDEMLLKQFLPVQVQHSDHSANGVYGIVNEEMNERLLSIENAVKSMSGLLEFLAWKNKN